MILDEIMKGIETLDISGDTGIDITGLSYDSRKADKGHLFFALPGEHADGHSFIEKAVERGAVAIVYERPGLYPSRKPESGSDLYARKRQQSSDCLCSEQFLSAAFRILEGYRHNRNEREDHNNLSAEGHFRGMGTKGGPHRYNTIYDKRRGL
jgi:UDP-N-acetylmuramyl pentapeptide synthase